MRSLSLPLSVHYFEEFSQYWAHSFEDWFGQIPHPLSNTRGLLRRGGGEGGGGEGGGGEGGGGEGGGRYREALN